MSFSWTYLTRRFLLQNYRDYIAASIVISYVGSKYMKKVTTANDNAWVMQHVYTHDESDIVFQEETNMTDGAVKRDKALKYAAKIRQLRAEREREAALDAYNYLNGKDHAL